MPTGYSYSCSKLSPSPAPVKRRPWAKVKYYRDAIRWCWKHRKEPNNRSKWRRMARELPEIG